MMVVVMKMMNTCNRHGDVRKLIYPGNNSEIPLFLAEHVACPLLRPARQFYYQAPLATNNTQYTIHNPQYTTHNTIAGAAETYCSQLFNTQVYNLQQEGPHKALLTKSKSGNTTAHCFFPDLTFFCMMSTVRVKIYCQ